GAGPGWAAGMTVARIRPAAGHGPQRPGTAPAFAHGRVARAGPGRAGPGAARAGRPGRRPGAGLPAIAGYPHCRTGPRSWSSAGGEGHSSGLTGRTVFAP